MNPSDEQPAAGVADAQTAAAAAQEGINAGAAQPIGSANDTGVKSAVSDGTGGYIVDHGTVEARTAITGHDDRLAQLITNRNYQLSPEDYELTISTLVNEIVKLRERVEALENPGEAAYIRNEENAGIHDLRPAP